MVSEIANPSTQGSGRNVSRLIPMTLMIVFMAATPSHPELRATLAGYKKKHPKITNMVVMAIMCIVHGAWCMVHGALCTGSIVLI